MVVHAKGEPPKNAPRVGVKCRSGIGLTPVVCCSIATGKAGNDQRQAHRGERVTVTAAEVVLVAIDADGKPIPVLDAEDPGT